MRAHERGLGAVYSKWGAMPRPMANVISMTLSPTRADMVLDAVLLELARSRVTESRSVHFHDSWTEGEDVICVLNAFPGIDALVGLRRRVSAELPLEEEVDEISNFDFGDPWGDGSSPS